ncbi:Mitochondrial Carrier [Sesbania bispinosa]|nr:Mitochondrial Carrier [Sesbania bispinosa]
MCGIKRHLEALKVSSKACSSKSNTLLGMARVPNIRVKPWSLKQLFISMTQSKLYQSTYPRQKAVMGGFLLSSEDHGAWECLRRRPIDGYKSLLQ